MLGRQRGGALDAVGAVKVLRCCFLLRGCGGDLVGRQNCKARGGGKAGRGVGRRGRGRFVRAGNVAGGRDNGELGGLRRAFREGSGVRAIKFSRSRCLQRLWSGAW
jgi:hypothetical protein